MKLNPDLPVDLTYTPDWNHGQPFTITGLALDHATAIQAELQAQNAEMDKVARKVQKATTEPENASGVALHGREYVKATVRTKLFDLVYRTNEYKVLEETRLLERRLRLRQSIGIMPVDHCAKHQHLVDKLKSV